MKNWALAAFVAFGIMVSAPAWALKAYSFSGRVTQVGPDSVVVESGEEGREFSKASLQKADLYRIGDWVTVWYTLNAQEVRVDRRAQPGEIRPGQQPGGSGGLEEPIPQIQDDRAFYSAKNDSSTQKKPSPRG